MEGKFCPSCDKKLDFLRIAQEFFCPHCAYIIPRAEVKEVLDVRIRQEEDEEDQEN